LIITAFNEGASIKAKIENSLRLDYPKDKLEIIVVSDDSRDGTDGIVLRFRGKGVKLLSIKGRRGKTFCQNKAISKAGGDIVIFTDAKSILQADVIKKLVRWFQYGNVGAVGGNIVYKNDKGQTKEGAYIRYEQKIREWESSLFGSTSTAGALYALRRRDYVELPDYAQSHFTEPISILLATGGKPKIDTEAVCFNISSGSSGGELKRHERIITRYHFTKRLVRDAYNPLRTGWYALGLMSHKSLRFYAPFIIVAIMVLNVFLLSQGFLWTIIFGLQILFYLLALAGATIDKSGYSNLMFSTPYHFVILNLAALKAWVNYLRGKNFITWSSKAS
jgi:glycosyltransferase involved in cell wall biosynthesis